MAFNFLLRQKIAAAALTTPLIEVMELILSKPWIKLLKTKLKIGVNWISKPSWQKKAPQCHGQLEDQETTTQCPKKAPWVDKKTITPRSQEITTNQERKRENQQEPNPQQLQTMTQNLTWPKNRPVPRYRATTKNAKAVKSKGKPRKQKKGNNSVNPARSQPVKPK